MHLISSKTLDWDQLTCSIENELTRGLLRHLQWNATCFISQCWPIYCFMLQCGGATVWLEQKESVQAGLKKTGYAFGQNLDLLSTNVIERHMQCKMHNIDLDNSSLSLFSVQGQSNSHTSSQWLVFLCRRTKRFRKSFAPTAIRLYFTQRKWLMHGLTELFYLSLLLLLDEWIFTRG